MAYPREQLVDCKDCRAAFKKMFLVRCRLRLKLHPIHAENIFISRLLNQWEPPLMLPLKSSTLVSMALCKMRDHSLG